MLWSARSRPDGISHPRRGHNRRPSSRPSLLARSLARPPAAVWDHPPIYASERASAPAHATTRFWGRVRAYRGVLREAGRRRRRRADSQASRAEGPSRRRPRIREPIEAGLQPSRPIGRPPRALGIKAGRACADRTADRSRPDGRTCDAGPWRRVCGFVAAGLGRWVYPVRG